MRDSNMSTAMYDGDYPAYAPWHDQKHDHDIPLFVVPNLSESCTSQVKLQEDRAVRTTYFGAGGHVWLLSASNGKDTTELWYRDVRPGARWWICLLSLLFGSLYALFCWILSYERDNNRLGLLTPRIRSCTDFLFVRDHGCRWGPTLKILSVDKVSKKLTTATATHIFVSQSPLFLWFLNAVHTWNIRYVCVQVMYNYSVDFAQLFWLEMAYWIILAICTKSLCTLTMRYVYSFFLGTSLVFSYWYMFFEWKDLNILQILERYVELSLPFLIYDTMTEVVWTSLDRGCLSLISLHSIHLEMANF
jgi:hypothetical protein